MSGFTEYNGSILVPVKIAEIKFYEKEETSLNSFQIFLIEAVEQGCNIPQIVEATLLTENAIEAEIEQMTVQNLFVKEGDNIVLSMLSKKLLMVTRCVKKLNDEHKRVGINLVTGGMVDYNNNEFLPESDGDVLTVRPKILERDIDGIGIEENAEFFKTYMDSLTDLSEEDKDTLLESIYIEFVSTELKIQYIKQNIKQVPNAEFTFDQNLQHNENVIYAVGCLYKIEYEIRSKVCEAASEILPHLLKISENNMDFLSAKGENIIDSFHKCEELNQTKQVLYYDCVSGECYRENPSADVTTKFNINLELPVINDLTQQVKDRLSKTFIKEFQLSDDFFLQEIQCVKKEYHTQLLLESLWEESDA